MKDRGLDKLFERKMEMYELTLIECSNGRGVSNKENNKLNTIKYLTSIILKLKESL